MKLRMILVGASVAALAVPVVAGAAPATTKVTGGGQTLTAGKDTIGFNAQTDGTTTKGQVQFVDRADTGTQTQYHGDVFCVAIVDDGDNATPVNAAIISGTWRSVNGKTTVADPGDYYTLYVEDNGEGANAVADQIVMQANVQNTDDQTGPTCETDIDPSDAQPELAHGNVQFHKGKPASRKRSRTSAPKVVSLAGLR